jgi:hypothetical protein
MGPAYTGVLASLAFHGEGGRSCIMGEHRAPSLCVCWAVGLTAE